MQKVRDRFLRILFDPLRLQQCVRYLELELTFQDFFLFADLIDDESLIVELNDIETLFVLVLDDGVPVHLVLDLFKPFEGKVIKHGVLLLQRGTLHG